MVLVLETTVKHLVTSEEEAIALVDEKRENGPDLIDWKISEKAETKSCAQHWIVTTKTRELTMAEAKEKI